MLVIDRLRQVFIHAGNPGLDLKVRTTASSVERVRQLLDEGLRQTTFDGPRRAHLLALALCWHDAWDDAHAICQSMEGDPDADFIHAVLHRREGDADNAQYWLARVGTHPVFGHLVPVAAAEGFTDLVADGAWRPSAFLTRCLRATATDRAGLIRVQAAELLAMVDHLAAHPITKPRPASSSR